MPSVNLAKYSALQWKKWKPTSIPYIVSSHLVNILCWGCNYKYENKPLQNHTSWKKISHCYCSLTAADFRTSFWMRAHFQGVQIITTSSDNWKSLFPVLFLCDHFSRGELEWQWHCMRFLLYRVRTVIVCVDLVVTNHGGCARTIITHQQSLNHVIWFHVKMVFVTEIFVLY